MPLRVIIADDETIVRMGLRAMLEEAGHEVSGEAASASQVFGLVSKSSSDVVLLDIQMPGMNALEAARRLWDEFALPVVFVTAFSDREMMARASEAGGFAYVVKPVREDQLLAAIAMAVARATDLKVVGETLETRKLVERAKGILMRQLAISEEEAHLLLHRQSRNQNKSSREVAEAVLAAEVKSPRASPGRVRRPYK